MSLIRKHVKALSGAGIPFDAAEAILRRRTARERAEAEISPAERMRRSRAEFVEENGIAESSAAAREERLSRWLGVDIGMYDVDEPIDSEE